MPIAVSKVDLSVDTFEVAGGEANLPIGEPLGVELTVAISVANGGALPVSVWPHFDLAYYVSLDSTLSPDDIRLQTTKTRCQKDALMESYSSISTINLDSSQGITLPMKGIERFCGATELFIGVVIDSYETDDGRGEVDEVLETNNVLWSQHTSLVGLNCDNNMDNEKMCK